MPVDNMKHYYNIWPPSTKTPFELRSGGGGRKTLIQRTPAIHGAKLRDEISDSWNNASDKRKSTSQELDMEPSDGILVTFESTELFNLDLDRFDLIRSGIELRAVKIVDGKEIATVFVPDNARQVFLKKIDKFSKLETTDGKTLFYIVEQILESSIKELWTENYPLPSDEDEIINWEIWLKKDDSNEGVRKLKDYCKNKELFFYDSYLHLNDRTILLVSSSISNLKQSIFVVPEISELRQASQLSFDFISMQPRNNREFIDDLINRTSSKRNNVLISIFDTGIKYLHPLIKPFLNDEHLKTVKNDWGVNDVNGHGTLMAGVALYENLASQLSNNQSYEINYGLESVKICSTNYQNHPQFIPAITETAFDLTADDDFKRVYVLSLTQDMVEYGVPTSQSSLIDIRTFGINGNSKLMIVPTGNRQEQLSEISIDYLDTVGTYQAQEPAQSWNALVVGGYTEMTSVSDVTFMDSELLAEKGELSPTSRVTTKWNEKLWPIKPDVVSEAGNHVSINSEINSIDDLSILTTSSKYNLLEGINGTSAASAIVAKTCAEILSYYPEYRAETVKGLVVHTANWTDVMLKKLDLDKRKTSIENLLRIYGYGVPNIKRALSSAQSSVTLIFEDEIIPYAANDNNSSQKINEWNIHSLPWPKEALKLIGDSEIELTVTLSYFIEPHASRRGFRNKYQYSSHGLRFAMQSPVESDSEFFARINSKEGEKISEDDNKKWMLGPTIRSHSICQKDIWTGTANELAGKSIIGVYPVGGWWKARGKKDIDKGLWGLKVHYSLLVSVSTKNTEIDLYSKIGEAINVINKVEIKV